MPSLPLELWRDALRLAVHIPGLFETKWDHSPDFLIWHGWDSPRSSSSDSLRTKVSICQVSKSWREIGVELLYEHLFFTEMAVVRLDSISKLVSIFEEHEGQRSYGRSTKRVDIHRVAFDLPWFPSLFRLLKSCHNIRIFNVTDRFFNAENQAELSSLLQNRFSHSLRRMGLDLSASHPLVYLPNVRLEALEISSRSHCTIDPPPAIATVTTLSVELSYKDEFLSWHFPALQHVTFHRILDSHSVSLESFMTTHGPQLHSLHLSINRYPYFTLLQKLLTSATNLRCLILSPVHMAWPLPGNSFPSITHLAFQSLYPQIAPEIEAFISESIFPGLQCIRFLYHDGAVGARMDSEQREVWKSLLEAGLRQNIRFENMECQSLKLQ